MSDNHDIGVAQPDTSHLELPLAGAVPSPVAFVDGEQVSAKELLNLCAVDPNFYARRFFPKTVRQAPAPFHREVDNILENDANRFVNIQMFRGSAKTTKLRLFTSRRICFALSRTILYLGASEGQATRSVRWIRNNVEHNRAWAEFFRLKPGKKWTDTECEILHGIDDVPIWIMAMGMTGAIRGINQDDFRPDLIICDDTIDDNTASTTEQRQKSENLLMGAVRQSLAPRSEAPHAKMVILNTPMHKEDASTKALSDPQFKSVVYGCFDARGESAWQARWTTEELLEEKAGYIRRNQLSTWMREKECKLVSPETAAFRAEWRRSFELAPPNGVTVMAIDPVPPPTDVQIQKGLKDKDWEAFAVVRRFNNGFYILETSKNRGHEPNWTIAEFFRLCLKWRPRLIVVETVAYQKTLQWILKQAMKARGMYWPVEEFTDPRSKYNLIVDSLSGPASNGQLYHTPGMTDFVEQFDDYPNVTHDDVLNAVAIAVKRLENLYGDLENGIQEELEEEDRQMEKVGDFRGCP